MKGFILCSIILVTTVISNAITLDGYITTVGLEPEPIENVLVQLADPADSTVLLSDVTDESGYFCINIIASGISNHQHMPDHVTLQQNYPNPFNPSTIIQFNLTDPGYVHLAVYNLLGQQIRSLYQGYAAMGQRQVIWDGRDNQGNGVAAGVYLYALTLDNGYRLHKKMLLLDGNHSPIHSSLHGQKIQQANTVLNVEQKHCFILKLSCDQIINIRQEITFAADTSLVLQVPRTMTDTDGNVYPIVKISNQWWMAENLRVTHYANGDPIPQITGQNQWSADSTIDAFCYYNNDSNNAVTFGALYNWYAATDPRQIAPPGWHVPTESEWQVLEIYLGLDPAMADSLGWRGLDVGGKLKSTGLEHWSTPNTGASNITGFSAQPGGYREYGTDNGFKNLGIGADFWTATEQSTARAWHHVLYYDRASSYHDFNNKKHGFSIRLVKDQP